MNDENTNLLCQKVKHLLSSEEVRTSKDNEASHNTTNGSGKQSLLPSSFLQETRQERYLTCCSCIILFLQNNNDDENTNGIVRVLLDGHSGFKSFVHELLKASLNNEAKVTSDQNNSACSSSERLNSLYAAHGIRILQSYYYDKLNDDSKNNKDEEEFMDHFGVVNGLMSQVFIHKKVSLEIASIDVEIIQLYTLLLQNFIKRWSWRNQCNNYEDDNIDTTLANSLNQSCGGAISKVSNLPAMIFDYYYIKFISKASPTIFSKINEKVSTTSDQTYASQAMVQILSSILKQNHDVLDPTIYRHQFEVAMVNLFNYHPQFMEIASAVSSQNTITRGDVALERSSLLNMLHYTTTPREDDLPIETKETNIVTRLFLHTSLMSLIHMEATKNISFQGNSIVQLLSSNQNQLDIEVAVLIQKICVINLSSILDHYTTHLNKEADDHTNESQSMMIIGRIRTLTLEILSTLLEQCGVDWVLCSNSKDMHGQSSMFCTIVRLVVGELRLVMGHLIDEIYENQDHRLDGNNKIETTGKAQMMQTNLTRIQYCIDIGLFILKVMLNIADSNKEESLEFRPDAILHVKHSFDDMLDSIVQFMLHMDLSLEVLLNNCDLYWEYGALLCSRYLGAYLSDVDIFDYDTFCFDDEESQRQSNDIKEDQQIGHDARKAPITTQTLFTALRNALLIQMKLMKTASHKESQRRNFQEPNQIKGNDAVTLFPCISTILASSIDDDIDEDTSKRRIKLTRKYLLDESDLVSLLCYVIDTSFNATLEDLYENDQADDHAKTLFWCNCVIHSLFQFMMKTSKEKFDSKDEKAIKSIHKSMSQWMRYIALNIPNDFILKENLSMMILQLINNLMSIRKHVSKELSIQIKADNDRLLGELL